LLPNLNKVVETVLGPLDPAPEFRFYVEIDGLMEGAFVECSGMKAERDVLPYREGGVNTYVHKLPGRISYGDITLRKGVMFSIELWEWFTKGMENGKVKRRDFTIFQHSSYFNMPSRWYHVRNAYPVAWEASSLRTDSNQFAMESLTLTFETIELEDMGVAAAMVMTAIPAAAAALAVL
jgi:phage tail-like protein